MLCISEMYNKNETKSNTELDDSCHVPIVLGVVLYFVILFMAIVSGAPVNPQLHGILLNIVFP